MLRQELKMNGYGFSKLYEKFNQRDAYNEKIAKLKKEIATLKTKLTETQSAQKEQAELMTSTLSEIEKQREEISALSAECATYFKEECAKTRDSYQQLVKHGWQWAGYKSPQAEDTMAEKSTPLAEVDLVKTSNFLNLIITYEQAAQAKDKLETSARSLQDQIASRERDVKNYEKALSIDELALRPLLAIMLKQTCE